MRGRRRKKAGRRNGKLALCLLGILLLGVLVAARVLVVRSIQVVGNRNVPRDEIVGRSGVHEGDHFVTLNRLRIRRGIEENRYLEYMGCEYDYKGTLTIRVKERVGISCVNVLGLYYVLDAAGVVLECTGVTRSESASGPEVTGLSINENIRIIEGEPIPVTDPLQLRQMERVIDALTDVNMLARITTLNVKSSESLSVMTREGAGIILGDDSNLTLKLLIAREVLSIRKEEGDLQGSRIDVSSGRDAHYIPKVLPTITPTPTMTPTPVPEETPKKR